MSDRDLVCRALQDACDWQRSLIEAYSNMPGDPAAVEARKTLAAYKRVLAKRYGSAEHPADRKLRESGARLVSLDELRAQSVAQSVAKVESVAADRPEQAEKTE